jgi:hypothetical protein
LLAKASSFDISFQFRFHSFSIHFDVLTSSSGVLWCVPGGPRWFQSKRIWPPMWWLLKHTIDSIKWNRQDRQLMA